MQKVRFAYNPKAGETVITDWLDNIIDIYQRGGYSIMPYRLAFTEAEETDLLDDIDGQPGPRFPVRIACEPGALRVICPQKKPKK